MKVNEEVCLPKYLHFRSLLVYIISKQESMHAFLPKYLHFRSLLVYIISKQESMPSYLSIYISGVCWYIL